MAVNKLKETNIRNRTYYYLDDLINLDYLGFKIYCIR